MVRPVRFAAETAALVLAITATFYALRATLSELRAFQDDTVFTSIPKCFALAGVFFHARRRAHLAGRIEDATDRDAKLALTAAIIAALIAGFVTTPVITFGYGHDGAIYAKMSEQFAWFTAKMEPPYSYRFLAPMLVAASGLGTTFAYQLLAIASFIGACLMLWLIGRRLGAPPPIIAAVVALFALTKFGLKFWIYYPVLMDPLGTFFLFACLYLIIAQKHALYAITLAIGLACRENLIIAIPVHLAYTLRDPEQRRQWPRYAALQLIPIAFYLAYKFHPVFLPSKPYSAGAMASLWLKRFFREPAHQHAFITAHFNSLGMLAVIPLMYARELLTFLRASRPWALYALGTLALSVAGGFDYDRFALWQTPLIAVFIFEVLAKKPVFRSSGFLIAIVALQLVASELLLYWDPSDSFYVSRYTGYSAGRSAFTGIMIFTVLLLVASFQLRRQNEIETAAPPA